MSAHNENGARAHNPDSTPRVLTGVTPLEAPSREQRSASEIWSAIPKIGAYRTTDHAYYWNGEGPYPGVTGILDVLNKPALVQWAKRTVAEIAVLKSEELLARIVRDGQEEAIKWLSSLPDYQRDAAARIGSGVHLLADMVARGSESDSETFQPSPDEMPYVEAFRRFLGFLEARGAKIVSSEKMIWSWSGYGGTYDLLVRFPAAETDQVQKEDRIWNGLALLDIKTSKGYYPEYALQLAAYGGADSIILEGNPEAYPMPKVDQYGVLHLRPDQYPDTGWRLIQYPVTEKDYRAFLSCLEIYRWKREGRFTRKALTEGASTRVIPDPLTQAV